MKNILVGLLILFYCTTLWGNKIEVIAIGFGPDRNEALRDAQRKAVEQGVGALVDSHSATANMVLIRDEIYTKARGFIEEFTILSEKEISAGDWQVQIKCKVSDDKLKYSLNALGLLRDKMDNPRIAIIWKKPDITGNREVDKSLISEAREGIAEHLSEREFPLVIDEKKAEYHLEYSINIADPESNNREKQDSDYFFKKMWVWISARIINVSNQRVIANQRKKVMGYDKDSAEFALKKAGRKAGKLTAKFLEMKLLNRWQGESVSGRPVVLKLTNIKNFSILVAFKAKLKEAYGVLKIFQRKSDSNKTEYELTYLGGIGTLKDTVFNILKEMRLGPGMPTSQGDRIQIRLSGR